MKPVHLTQWSGLATPGPAAGLITVFAEGIEEMWDSTAGLTWHAPSGPPVILYGTRVARTDGPGGPRYLPARLIGQSRGTWATPGRSRPPRPARRPRS
jgi:hypothetical protein